MGSPGGSRARRALALGGGALLAAWVAWWIVALVRLDLPGFASTWIPQPAFGADFWTQPEYAARSWYHRVDPYANERHLFHYPPLVIRLFLWVNYVPPAAALRIWIVANALVLVAATLAALRVREALGLPLPPRALALALVLWSFPVVFELERANFDLITLFVVLAAAPLLRRGARVPDLLAGALLAVGPWVKLYPGVLGLLLVGLRRRWALAGFAAAGIAIGAATPRETIRSFEVLRIAVHRVHGSTLKLPLSTWTHSVTAALTKLAQAVPEPALRTKLLALPLGALAVALVVASLVPLALRVFRHPAPERLYLPLACLLLAAGSTAPEIANDYSLAFLPIAAVAVVTTRDPLPVRALLAGGAIVLQPFALPIPAAAVLSLKLGALVGVGLAIGRRLAELPRAPGSDAP